MASSLSRSTDTVRKAIIVFIIFAISTFVIQFIVEIAKPVVVTPPIDGTSSAYEKKDQALGQIPRPIIRSLQLAPQTKADFALEGKFNTQPPVVNVYSLLKPRENFGDFDKAKAVATRLGFDSEAVRTSENDLFWQTSGQTRQLRYNKADQSWEYKVNLATDPLLGKRQPLSVEQGYYEGISTGLLRLVGVTSNGTPYFSGANSRVDYINIDQQGKLTRVLTPDKANYVRISIYKRVNAAALRENYKPGPTEKNPKQDVFADVRKNTYLNGPANFVIQNKATKPSEDVVSFDYKDLLIGNKGVYSILGIEAAWVNVQSNKGYIYWMRPEDRSIFDEHQQVNVTRFVVNAPEAKIVYIEPDSWIEKDAWTHYLQPFYMFSGLATLEDGRQAEFSILTEALSPEQYIAQNQ